MVDTPGSTVLSPEELSHEQKRAYVLAALDAYFAEQFAAGRFDLEPKCQDVEAIQDAIEQRVTEKIEEVESAFKEFGLEIDEEANKEIEDLRHMGAGIVFKYPDEAKKIAIQVIRTKLQAFGQPVPARGIYIATYQNLWVKNGLEGNPPTISDVSLVAADILQRTRTVAEWTEITAPFIERRDYQHIEYPGVIEKLAFGGRHNPSEHFGYYPYVEYTADERRDGQPKKDSATHQNYGQLIVTEWGNHNYILELVEVVVNAALEQRSPGLITEVLSLYGALGKPINLDHLASSDPSKNNNFVRYRIEETVFKYLLAKVRSGAPIEEFEQIDLRQLTDISDSDTWSISSYILEKLAANLWLYPIAVAHGYKLNWQSVSRYVEAKFEQGHTPSSIEDLVVLDSDGELPDLNNPAYSELKSELESKLESFLRGE